VEVVLEEKGAVKNKENFIRGFNDILDTLNKERGG
jgi:hypothetical protein